MVDTAECFDRESTTNCVDHKTTSRNTDVAQREIITVFSADPERRSASELMKSNTPSKVTNLSWLALVALLDPDAFLLQFLNAFRAGGRLGSARGQHTVSGGRLVRSASSAHKS